MVSTKLRKWCNENSIPREIPKQPKVDRGKKVVIKKILADIIRLSTPPKRLRQKGDKKCKKNPFKISVKALKYRASKRIVEISQPRHKYVDPCDDPDQNFSNFLVKDSALNYKASKRIQKLAQHIEKIGPGNCSLRNLIVSEGAKKYEASPRIKEISKYPERWNKIQACKDPNVSKAALNGTASPRTAVLAKPRKYKSACNPNQLMVKKSALNYTATPRIEKLAKPRKVPKKYHC